MKHSDFILLMALALNDVPEKNSDVIVFVEGDGYSRPRAAARLYRAGFAPKILVSGEVRRPQSRKKLRIDGAVKKLIELGVPPKDILLETKSIGSREEALEILKFAKTHGWKKIIIAAPLYHTPRLYATLVRAINEVGPKVKIVNSAVRGLNWFRATADGQRFKLFKKELEKIERYAARGHVASLREILRYHRWKEKQSKS